MPPSHRTQVTVAYIGAATAVAVAVITGGFGLVKSDGTKTPPASDTPPTSADGSSEQQESVAFLLSAIPSAINRGELESADRMATEVLQREPNNHLALNSRGSVAFYDQHFKEAAAFFDRAYQLKPQSIAYRYNLADTYVELGLYDRAKQLYESLPDDGNDLWYAKGRLALLRGEYKESAEWLKVVSTGHNRGTARILRAAALAALKAPEAAAELKTGLAQDPQYWKDVLSGKRIEPRESYSQVAALLETHNVWKH